jgi:hypothetical protein
MSSKPIRKRWALFALSTRSKYIGYLLDDDSSIVTIDKYQSVVVVVVVVLYYDDFGSCIVVAGVVGSYCQQ